MQSRPSHYDVVGDVLYSVSGEDCKDELILAPNEIRRGCPRKWNLDGDKVVHDLTDVDHRDEMQWIETAYAPEIEKLREAYATVEVRWGLTQYWT